nr:MAG TPA: hypothetical protein [Caudoviricetes sp.]
MLQINIYLLHLQYQIFSYLSIYDKIFFYLYIQINM